FAATNFNANEYDGVAVVTVVRSGGTVNPLSVDFMTRNGTASNLLDYVALNGTLSFRGDEFVVATNGTGELVFQPGETTQTINIQLIDDVLGEGNETFRVVLTNARSSSILALPGAT